MDKILFAIIAIGYLILAFMRGGLIGALRMGVGLMLPFVFIWFADTLSHLPGMRGAVFSSNSPTWLIKLVGWGLLIVFLVGPLIFSKG